MQWLDFGWEIDAVKSKMWKKCDRKSESIYDFQTNEVEKTDYNHRYQYDAGGRVGAHIDRIVLEYIYGK